MDIAIIEAKSFLQRSDLETYVVKHFGLTATKKVNVVIGGTKHDMAQVGLSEKMIFWGISCELGTEDGQPAHEDSTPAPSAVDRGETKPFGITGSTTKPTGL